MTLTGGLNLTVQNANFGGTGTSQNPGQQYIFVLNDGSAGATSALTAAKPAGGVAAATQDLGNGSTSTSYATAFDSSGNATQQVNVISVNVGPASGLTTQAGQTTAINDLVTAMNATGFGASVDNNNNLSIAGNNVSLTDAATTITNTAVTIAASQLTGAAATIAAVSGAVNKLGNISAQLGDASNQISGLQSFTSSLSNALTAGVGALTDAESAKLTSLQTKQQLAIQSLSIANQQPQSLLSLFK
jgi:flagellin